MMHKVLERIGVVGDIHAQDERLEVTLEFLRKEAVPIMCTGDVVDGKGDVAGQQPGDQAASRGMEGLEFREGKVHTGSRGEAMVGLLGAAAENPAQVIGQDVPRA